MLKKIEFNDILKSLNDQQRKAVTTTHPNLLVLAGAGSGKTRVLVHRIAWLVKVQHCSPLSIMTVTFNTQAADELCHRTQKILGLKVRGMWIGTFHSLAHRLLRNHYYAAKLPSNFRIIDQAEQLRLIKKIIIKYFPQIREAEQALYYINSRKNEGLRPDTPTEISEIQHRQNHFVHIYKIYQSMCDRVGLVDFSELLLRVKEMWLDNPSLLQKYRSRFNHILVDEFQDTNNIQYELIQLLSNNHNNIMIVGDDDQSIYSWRDANTKNIQRFITDFIEVKIIRLEQNYRSPNYILTAANALIAHNIERLEKTLWTNKSDGERITLYKAYNDLDEAQFVVNRIKSWHKTGGNLKQCAILYRSKAQSKVIEDELLKSNVRYYISGRIKFFERQEIQDVLAYLRLIVNHNDDRAFERIFNKPPRGLGKNTLQEVRKISINNNISLWDSACTLVKQSFFSKRIRHALRCFTLLIAQLKQNIAEMALYLQVDYVIKNSGLGTWYQLKIKFPKEQQSTRMQIKNLKQLVIISRQYSNHQHKEGRFIFGSPLQSFIYHATRENLSIANNNLPSEYVDAVQMMSMHCAKGLEFPIVFLVGMEEGWCPTHYSIENRVLIQEERRLAYVAMTRAMKKLIVSWSQKRRLYGKELYYKRSRFINELPSLCIDYLSSSR
ncbi:MAG: UvrD-helicase domain-containing protein [Candidatus Dasytiphilus stammeri]